MHKAANSEKVDRNQTAAILRSLLNPSCHFVQAGLSFGSLSFSYKKSPEPPLFQELPTAATGSSCANTRSEETVVSPGGGTQ